MSEQSLKTLSNLDHFIGPSLQWLNFCRQIRVCFGLRARLSFVLAVALLSSLLSAQSSAQWVEVTGKAAIVNGDYAQARLKAREDGLRQASLGQSAQVQSEQMMDRGKLVHDRVKLSSSAHINKSVVVDEFVWADVMNLVMKVDVTPLPECPLDKANGYRKKVVVLGFSLQTPGQARFGHLEAVDRGVASRLNQALHEQDNLLVFESSQYRLYDETVNAPSMETAQHTFTKAASIAQQLGTQFVISGVIRDLGVENPEDYAGSYWQRMKNLVRLGNHNRRFVLELFVHDGLSGAIVMQRRYGIVGEWDFGREQKVAFGSAKFNHGDYGRKVNGLIREIARDINEELRCQPFMVRITRVSGKQIQFPSGARAGIKPGDKLALYRSYHFEDANLSSGNELTSAKTVLTVSQVQPNFSTGRINIEPGRINIQEDDLLIAW